MDKLEKARANINEIDKQMAQLFTNRMKEVKAVAEYKQEHGLPVYDEEREKKVIEKNSALVEDDTIRSYYINFLQNNMDIAKRYQSMLQQGQKVAYSGVNGAFAQIAAKKIFPSANLVSCNDFKQAYDLVVNGECECAVLPIENSYAGEVSQVIDMMFQGPLFVNGIYDLEVSQNLLGLHGASVNDIKTVISHPQALSQCAEYIKKHGLTTVNCTNTAVAALEVAEKGDKTWAAIASRDTADLYGLSVIENKINESNMNTTRFAVFSRVENKTDEKEKDLQFILVFTVRNEAGALAQAINIIGGCGFNMRTLRSRPMKELMWEYYFYVEAYGNAGSADGKKMMNLLSEHCDKLRIIGTFAHEKVLD